MPNIACNQMKITYHCFSCNENFTDLETARGHSKSLSHEATERARGVSEDGKSLLI
jgi:hypothetical protein